MKFLLKVSPRDLEENILSGNLSEKDAEKTIIAIDAAVQDFEFTERIAKRLISSLYACDENFNAEELVPKEYRKKRAP